ncbi:hypothetical protein L1987_15730 [Smallanthus sonchifolius]|uniref:Uncharacterized protein n=1 Tax=Smallanthus sonchifolius TaxID=185202 RepID=A0ACB9J6W6_9ASTR|nr:hypothetical protein L1987_15730 [Smallanthus sonchifolius]
MDEEELQKRFIDCVYFLATPLTCKKKMATPIAFASSSVLPLVGNQSAKTVGVLSQVFLCRLAQTHMEQKIYDQEQQSDKSAFMIEKSHGAGTHDPNVKAILIET